MSRQRLREVEAAEAEIEQEFPAESAEKSRGRPKKRKSKDAVSQRTGIPRSTIKDAQRHVSVADEFPALQAPDWKEGHVIRADECLKEIGWKTIPGRRYEKLSQEELRALEQDENALRKDLDSYEASKERLREIEAAEVEAEEEFRSQSDQKPKPGRPRTAGSERETAKRTGLSKTEVHNTRRHVSAAEEFPALQAPDWTHGSGGDRSSG